MLGNGLPKPFNAVVQIEETCKVFDGIVVKKNQILSNLLLFFQTIRRVWIIFLSKFKYLSFTSQIQECLCKPQNRWLLCTWEVGSYSIEPNYFPLPIMLAVFL